MPKKIRNDGIERTIQLFLNVFSNRNTRDRYATVLRQFCGIFCIERLKHLDV